MMFHDSIYYVLLILLVTCAQVLVLRTHIQEPTPSITGSLQHNPIQHRRIIHEHTAASSKAGDYSPQQWSWDEVDIEPVEERSTPYNSHKLNEESDYASAAIKARLAGGKHKKHHRHDIHLHLPTSAQNRTGERLRSPVHNQ
jgi:hypothetical protein